MRLVLSTAVCAAALAVAVGAADPDPLVDLRKACPGIQIELRYATSRNLTGKPIYPPNARALALPSVVEKLNHAHQLLQARGFGLKIWDAYRPQSAQQVLWNAVRNRAYVVEPSGFGSLHSWGAAVDVTLVDFGAREVRMPTDFDDFTPAARYHYAGKDPEIAANLKVLQYAMAAAGFRRIRDEWWHYSVSDGLPKRPPDVPLEPPDGISQSPVPPPESSTKPASSKTSPVGPKKATRTPSSSRPSTTPSSNP